MSVCGRSARRIGIDHFAGRRSLISLSIRAAYPAKRTLSRRSRGAGHAEELLLELPEELLLVVAGLESVEDFFSPEPEPLEPLELPEPLEAAAARESVR